MIKLFIGLILIGWVVFKLRVFLSKFWLDFLFPLLEKITHSATEVVDEHHKDEKRSGFNSNRNVNPADNESSTPDESSNSGESRGEKVVSGLGVESVKNKSLD